MAPTPSSAKPNSGQGGTLIRTPQAKHRLQFNPRTPHPSPNPNSAVKEAPTAPAEHPVEVVGRVRDYPDRKEKPISILQVNSDRQSVRVRTDFGYRDFTLDGVSLSEEQDLDEFYKQFVVSRINGVKLGDKCTIMMYGPTGSGKSHTMFGCSKQPGIVYRSLKDILGESQEEGGGDVNDQRVGVGTFVQVTVLEIYNEEIYDLLSSNGGGFGLGWPKSGSASKVRLEVMGKKAKNATYISGTEAGKISKEIQKVEKRRIVKSTLCNDRSSRSHCMVILDVPTVGGRLMLVDMAGSENIEQAGQVGFEAKMQTAKINQGNIALKRVVESIANGDSHVPFRDSKLTMLLQDSFEDDQSKMLMILCASPDPKEIHKTVSTLEYGAKAKCIVRGPHTPIKDKMCSEDSSTVILGSRIAAMDQFIYKLQMENKLREKERNEAHKELMKKEEEVAALRSKLDLVEGKGSGASEEEINLKVNERTLLLRHELEKKLEECQRMTNEFVELERRRMEEKILQQQEEVEMLRRRLEEIEYELHRSRDANGGENGSRDIEGSGFAKRLMGIYANEDPGMVKSMDLDMGDQEPFVRDVKQIDPAVHLTENSCGQGFLNLPYVNTSSEAVDDGVFAPKYGDKICLSTVFEEEEVEEEDNELKENMEDEEVEKGIIEEKRVCSGDTASSRRMRIQNIFTLCGNHRELSHTTTIPCENRPEAVNSQASLLKTVGEDSALEVFSKMNTNQISHDNQISSNGALASVKLASEQKLTESLNLVNKSQISDDTVLASKENIKPIKESIGDQTETNRKENLNPIEESMVEKAEVYVKWEASKENPGKFITTLKVAKDASLSELRKLIETHLGAAAGFTFLALQDPTGAPVPREKEGTVQACKLPVCNNQLRGHLACLRPAKGFQAGLDEHIPLSPLENKLPHTPNLCFNKLQDVGFSPKVDQSLSSTPYITNRRHRILSPS